jgi:hypothetical protein
MHWWPASNKPKPTCMKLWMDFRIIEVAEKNILNGLVEMFHSQSLWDVHFFFKCGNSIGAHVVVFQSAGSPVFNVMFQSEFVDIKMEVFKQFFYFRSSCTPAKPTWSPRFQSNLRNECVPSNHRFCDPIGRPWR